MNTNGSVMQSNSAILRDDHEHEFAEAFAWLAGLMQDVLGWRHSAEMAGSELTIALATAWAMLDEQASAV